MEVNNSIKCGVHDCKHHALLVVLGLGAVARIDIDDVHRLGVFDDQVGAAAQRDVLGEERLDLLRDVEVSLEHEFEGNARSQQTAQRAREQLAADRGAKTDNRTAEADNIGAFIANIAAQVGNAEAGRQERAAERSRRSAGDTERERRAKEAKRAAEASMRRHQRDDLEL